MGAGTVIFILIVIGLAIGGFFAFNEGFFDDIIYRPINTDISCDLAAAGSSLLGLVGVDNSIGKTCNIACENTYFTNYVKHKCNYGRLLCYCRRS